MNCPRLEFLEAVYDWEAEEEVWLRGVLRTAVSVWGTPPWACAFAYDASDPSHLTFRNLVFAEGLAHPEPFVEGILNMPPEFVGRMYRARPTGFGRQGGSELEPMFRELEPFGSVDVFGINGLDPSGVGCLVAIGAERSALTAEQSDTFRRMAAHLSSAFRCRRRLMSSQEALESSEAVLDHEGRLLEARGLATSCEAQSAIKTAAQRIARIRSSRSDSKALHEWHPRTETRWTLVDTFSEAGQRYIVARENRATAPGLTHLTDREQQVVVCLAHGMTTKEIAYELGVSDATVRVLLGRACRRMGVQSRSELFALPSLKRIRGE